VFNLHPTVFPFMGKDLSLDGERASPCRVNVSHKSAGHKRRKLILL
jgi:hypothetical protein